MKLLKHITLPLNFELQFSSLRSPFGALLPHLSHVAYRLAQFCVLALLGSLQLKQSLLDRSNSANTREDKLYRLLLNTPLPNHYLLTSHGATSAPNFRGGTKVLHI